MQDIERMRATWAQLAQTWAARTIAATVQAGESVDQLRARAAQFRAGAKATKTENAAAMADTTALAPRAIAGFHALADMRDRLLDLADAAIAAGDPETAADANSSAQQAHTDAHAVLTAWEAVLTGAALATGEMRDLALAGEGLASALGAAGDALAAQTTLGAALGLAAEALAEIGGALKDAAETFLAVVAIGAAAYIVHKITKNRKPA